MSARKSLNRFLQSGTDRTKCTLRAAWYLDAVSAPVRDARLVLDSGRLVEVTTHSDPNEVDLRPWIAIPPLINAHTHLEFSDFKMPLPAGDTFADWIRQTVAMRRSGGRDPLKAIELGIAESVDFGVQGIGEIATSDLSVEALRRSDCDSIIFREMIGLSSSAAASRLEEASSFLRAFSGRSDVGGEAVSEGSSESPPDLIPAYCRPGLSPHAPYTVHPELLQGVIELAGEHQIPVAMHLAETLEEVELLENGSGPFRAMLEDLGVWNAECFAGGCSVLEILHALQKVTSCFVVHGNYLSKQEQNLITNDRRFALVVCPRTHRHFRHAAHPWRSMLDSGARILVGTDGRGSNPDLDVWSDLREMHRQSPDVPASKMLRMVTVDARESLGFDSPSSVAGLTLLEARETNDPDATLLADASKVVMTVRWSGSQMQIAACNQGRA